MKCKIFLDTFELVSRRGALTGTDVEKALMLDG